MYEKFFGLKENPFSIAPDPRYLYMSEKHRDALAHLLFGIEREGGVVVLTGEVGTGKTTLCRYFLQRLPENVEMAFILHPRLTARELLGAICDEFGIAVHAPAQTKSLVDAIHRFLLQKHAEGIHLALLIDEAQNLSADVLEQLRLLTNLETDRKKLLQIILLGQPELRDLLAQDNLRQLAQRVTARYHLDALQSVDVRAYVSFRLSVAGCSQPVFSDQAIRKLYSLSQGIPRLINLIADRAMLGAYSEHEHRVTRSMVKKAAREVGFLAFQEGDSFWHRHAATLKAGLSGILVGGAVLLIAAYLWPQKPVGTPEAEASPGGLPEASVERSVLSNEDSEGSQLEGGPSAPEQALDAAGAVFEREPEPQETRLPVVDEERWQLERSAARLGRYRARNDNKLAAYNSLLVLWDLEPISDRTKLACGYAELQGLRCLHREGNWRRLILLDRPAVLRLLNDQSEPYYLTLLSLDKNGMATIELDGRRMRVALEEIDRRWEGDYSILYRLPPFQSQIIRPGMIQDEGLWLNQQLDEVKEGLIRQGAEGLDLSAAEGSLSDRIRWFQALAGLEKDGVAGAMTYISLNNWLVDSGVPRLSAPVEEDD